MEFSILFSFFGFVHLLSLRFGAELASENKICVLITQFVQTNYWSKQILLFLFAKSFLTTLYSSFAKYFSSPTQQLNWIELLHMIIKKTSPCVITNSSSIPTLDHFMNSVYWSRCILTCNNFL
jgi:hypothetical protein